MNENVNSILDSITDFLSSEVKTETIIGKEFQLGEFKCVPVMGVGFGLGIGGGEGEAPKEGKGAGSGGGAGMGMTPVGFLVTRGDIIQFIPARNPSGLAAAFEKVPDIINTYMEKNNGGKKS
jgi:uncharacterized spore protein YtfJ